MAVEMRSVWEFWPKPKKQNTGEREREREEREGNRHLDHTAADLRKDLINVETQNPSPMIFLMTKMPFNPNPFSQPAKTLLHQPKKRAPFSSFPFQSLMTMINETTSF